MNDIYRGEIELAPWPVDGVFSLTGPILMSY